MHADDRLVGTMVARILCFWMGLASVLIGLVAGGSIRAAIIEVGSDDLVDGQYRLQYSSWADAYFTNGTEWVSGWTNGASEWSNLRRYAEATRWYLMPNAGPGTGTVTWAFDLDQTGLVITNLQVRSSSHIFHNSGSGDWARFYVSTNGSEWVNYSTNLLGSTAGTYYDLTEHVYGSAQYWIRAEVYVDTTSYFDGQLFREAASQAPEFENQVAMGLIPEPSLLALLGGPMAIVMIGRRNRRTAGTR